MRLMAPAPSNSIETAISHSAQFALAGTIRGGNPKATGTLAVEDDVAVVDVLLTVATFTIGLGPL